MIRSTAFAAEFVWSVAKTSRPVSAAVERHAHRLEVPHLADEEAVGVFPDRRLHPLREARHVRADLALREDRSVVGVDELDRVLDRDDVLRGTAVHAVEDRCERRRLAAARRSGHENEAPRRRREVRDRLGQRQLLDRRDSRRNEAEDRSRSALLPEEVHAKPRVCPHLVGEVHVSRFRVLLPDSRGSDRPDEVVEVSFGQGAIAHAFEIAVDAQNGRRADREVQVRAVPLRQYREEPVDPVRSGGDDVELTDENDLLDGLADLSGGMEGLRLAHAALPSSRNGSNDFLAQRPVVAPRARRWYRPARAGAGTCP